MTCIEYIFISAFFRNISYYVNIFIKIITHIYYCKDETYMLSNFEVNSITHVVK